MLMSPTVHLLVYIWLPQNSPQFEASEKMNNLARVLVHSKSCSRALMKNATAERLRINCGKNSFRLC